MKLISRYVWLLQPSLEELSYRLMVWKQLRLSSPSVLLSHLGLGRADTARASLALDSGEGALWTDPSHHRQVRTSSLEAFKQQAAFLEQLTHTLQMAWSSGGREMRRMPITVKGEKTWGKRYVGGPGAERPRNSFPKTGANHLRSKVQFIEHLFWMLHLFQLILSPELQS